MRLQSRFPAVLPALLLFAFSALADEAVQVFVHPAVPTTATPIQFHVAGPCPSQIGTPVRAGSVIRIDYTIDRCSPSIPSTATIALPEKTLPAGQYRVELYNLAAVIVLPIPVLISTAVFTVHDADPQPFRVLPSVSFKGGDRVRIESTSGASLCASQSCSIRFGGIAGTNPVVEADRSISITAPPLAPGVHDVSSSSASGPALIAKGAWYVFDESIQSQVDRSQFEHVLIPLLFNGPGANGSQWRSELVVANSMPWPIPLGNTNLTLSMVWRNYVLGARSRETELGFANPFGTVLLVPRRGADGLAMSLRVRDLSREAEGFGTEVPVVREQDMAHERPVTLLNVPLDAKYRAKLRVYAIVPEAVGRDVVLRIEPRAGALAARSQFIALRRECGRNRACSDTPLYGELDLPAVANGRADLQLETLPGALLWAFVSITNNDTQQVTIVTPSDKGTVSCAVCN